MQMQQPNMNSAVAREVVGGALEVVIRGNDWVLVENLLAQLPVPLDSLVSNSLELAAPDSDIIKTLLAWGAEPTGETVHGRANYLEEIVRQVSRSRRGKTYAAWAIYGIAVPLVTASFCLYLEGGNTLPITCLMSIAAGIALLAFFIDRALAVNETGFLADDRRDGLRPLCFGLSNAVNVGPSLAIAMLATCYFCMRLKPEWLSKSGAIVGLGAAYLIASVIFLAVELYYFGKYQTPLRNAPSEQKSRPMAPARRYSFFGRCAGLVGTGAFGLSYMMRSHINCQAAAQVGIVFFALEFLIRNVLPEIFVAKPDRMGERAMQRCRQREGLALAAFGSAGAILTIGTPMFFNVSLAAHGKAVMYTAVGFSAWIAIGLLLAIIKPWVATQQVQAPLGQGPQPAAAVVAAAAMPQQPHGFRAFSGEAHTLGS